MRTAAVAMLAAVAPVACLDATRGTRPAAAALRIDEVSVSLVSGNVVAAIATVRAHGADSVVVRYRLRDASVSASDSVAPAVTMVGDSAAVPVYGLLPASEYLIGVMAYGAERRVMRDSLALTTGALPSDLPAYDAAGIDPSPGYVVFSAARYGIVIDNTGRVVWYHRLPGPSFNFMAQPNTRRYVARPEVPDATTLAPWIEIDPNGTVTRTMGCAFGLQSRPHDLIADADGGYWIMCDETRTMDLAAIGGLSDARVTGTVVQHIGRDGTLRFQWSAFDHFALTDLDPAGRAGPAVNWTHGNALDLDADGGLIVSFRSLSEVTKIDTSTGTVIWRLGGRANQFTFADSPVPAFVRQHGARLTSTGELLLLDNTGDPTRSAAERYTLDARERTARLVRTFAAFPGVLTPIGGSVQSLAGARTLVSFGTAGRVEEYDASGRVVWRILGNPGYIFRAQRIRSLYAPGEGTAR